MKNIFVICLMLITGLTQAQEFDFSCDVDMSLGSFIPGATDLAPDLPSYGNTNGSFVTFQAITSEDEIIYTLQSKYLYGESIDNNVQGYNDTFNSSIVFNRLLAITNSNAYPTTSSNDTKFDSARVVDDSKFNGYVRVRFSKHYQVFAKWTSGNSVITAKIVLHTISNGNNHYKWNWGAQHKFPLNLHSGVPLNN